MKLFKPITMSDEVVKGLELVQKQKVTAAIAFTQATSMLEKADEEFWKIIENAYPEIKDCYVRVDIDSKTITPQILK